MKISNGIEHTQFIQLANGIKKKAYGNLLVDFSVKRFCDTFNWYKYGQNWKIGNPKICGWKEEDFNEDLPKDILKEGTQTMLFSKMWLILNHFSTLFPPQFFSAIGWRKKSNNYNRKTTI